MSLARGLLYVSVPKTFLSKNISLVLFDKNRSLKYCWKIVRIGSMDAATTGEKLGSRQEMRR